MTERDNLDYYLSTDAERAAARSRGVFPPSGTIGVAEAVALIHAKIFGSNETGSVEVTARLDPHTKPKVGLFEGGPLSEDDMVGRRERHHSCRSLLGLLLQGGGLAADVVLSDKRYAVPYSYWETDAALIVLTTSKFSSGGPVHSGEPTPAYANYEGAPVVVDEAAFKDWLGTVTVSLKSPAPAAEDPPAPNPGITIKSRRGPKRGPYFSWLKKTLMDLRRLQPGIFAKGIGAIETQIREESVRYEPGAGRRPQPLPKTTALQKAIKVALAEIEETSVKHR